MRLALLIVGSSVVINLLAMAALIDTTQGNMTAEVLSWFLNPVGWLLGVFVGLGINQVLKARE